uniref:Tudor domain-containing protein 7B n=1 Tax=Periophthalmus magnuspinnatus TaxID=409849 RepID=A0A3B4AVZ7_9GOBI
MYVCMYVCMCIYIYIYIYPHTEYTAITTVHMFCILLYFADSFIQTFCKMLHTSNSCKLIFFASSTCPNRANEASRSFLSSCFPVSRSDKRMTLPSHFHKEVQAHLSKNTPHTGRKGQPYSSTLVQRRLRDILAKYSNGFWVSKLPQIYRELYKEDLPTIALKELETWSHICTVRLSCGHRILLYYMKKLGSASTIFLHLTRGPAPTPASTAPPPSSRTPSPKSQAPPPSPPHSAQTCRPKQTLLKYPNGLWAHALPKLFHNTYKTKLPGHVLDNLHLLSHICTIDYPMSDNPKRAILYRRSSSNRADTGPNEEEVREVKEVKEVKEEKEDKEEKGLKEGGTRDVPLLQPPSEEYPSVLVVEAADTNVVILRYIGDSYSQAQEVMEDEMRKFYSTNQSSLMSPVSVPQLGQLVAVRAEDEEEVLRAQVCELMHDKVKVYYVDHGFMEVISKNKVFDLNEKFFKLPFQAAKCKLAGLEQFCKEPAVLKTLETMASGKILLAEILERRERPLVVLYDTSQDDDVNINSACLRALQDCSLASPLQVNSVYMGVTVSSVCSDGTLYCQLPSRGLHKLRGILNTIETYFQSQVTSEHLVSLPFCGKACLARYKGKWARVEIKNLHGSRVLDILFVDVGVQASVEVFELREIPQAFLKDLLSVPAQAVQCCLADLVVSLGSWTPEAVQWLRERVLHLNDCSLKVAKVDETKGCVHIHLFTDKNFHEATRSLNHQMAHSQLFRKQPDIILTSHRFVSLLLENNTCSPANGTAALCTPEKPQLRKLSAPKESPSPPDTPDSPPLPPLVELPPTGQNLDVYVSVACHPGHFVLQPWRDMYKLVVLMGEMILYYNRTENQTQPQNEPPQLRVHKGLVYAAKVDNNWYRVLVKGVLTTGLVSVYELDYGRHELVSSTQLQPLVQDFRRLPFQALTAQLAGVKQRQWSEEASMVFRNHVEKKALVAQLEAVQDASEPWERRLSVYLVDTSQEDQDVWVHDIMAEFTEEISNEM